MCFDSFLARQQVCKKSKMSVWQIIVWFRGSFGRCRRERRCAGEDKEEGLLRTVDCVFKSWYLFAFSRTVQEFFQCGIQHAAPQGAAYSKAIASATDSYENSCW